MRVIGSPHHIILAQQIHEPRAHRVALKRHKSVYAKVIARFKPQSEVERFLFFVLVVHPLQEIGNPSNAGLTQDESKSGIAVKGSGINDGSEEFRGAET